MTVSLDSVNDHCPAFHPEERLRTREDAEAYVAATCFRQGTPALLGVELEWTVHHRSDATQPLDEAALISALGDHAPTSLRPGSPNRRLPHGHHLSVEPGGQVEISSTTSDSLTELCASVQADAAYLSELLADSGLVMGERGTDPWRRPRRIVDLPRYDAMEAVYDRIGPEGRLMLCNTAGVQVCLDAGTSDRIAARWAALHALGPVMLAAFANSPVLMGNSTGWASSRIHCLLNTDPPRTRPGPVTKNPPEAWARRVLDTPLLCLRRPSGDWHAPSGVSFAEWIHRRHDSALSHEPTVDDLEYHLTTIFPPVRPRGYLEVRYLDTQPGQDWMLLLAAFAALFRKESTVDRVLEFTEPVANRWVHAARHGLRDTHLAHAAQAVVELACTELASGSELATPDSGVRERALADALADSFNSHLHAARR